MPDVESMAPWLTRTIDGLVPDFPGLPGLADWAGRLPLSCVDLFAMELELSPGRNHLPPSLHVRVPRDRADDLVDGSLSWLSGQAGESLLMISSIAASGIDGGERGFVCEAGPSGYALAAAYANVSGAGSDRAESFRRISAVLGVPEGTIAVAGRLAPVPPAYVGVMPGRPGSPTRLVYSADPDGDLWDALIATGAGSAAAVTSARALADERRMTESSFVNVDIVDGHLGPSIGLELKPLGDATDLAARSRPLRDWLAAPERQVEPSALAALAAWEGESLTSATGAAPSSGDLARLFAGEPAPGSRQRINHVKVTFDPTGRWSLKVYLFTYRIELRRAESGGDGHSNGIEDSGLR